MEMKLRKFLVTLLILSVKSCNGQKFSPGACPTVTPVPIAIANPGLLGIWVEYARTFNIGEHGWKCVIYNFAQVVANLQETVTIQGVHKITGAAKTATGTVNNNGALVMGNFVGTLNVLFSSNKILIRDTPVSYTVVGLDTAAAVSWITLYGCRNVGLGKLEYVIILTNARSPTPAIVNAAFNAATTAGVPSALIKKTDQTGC